MVATNIMIDAWVLVLVVVVVQPELRPGLPPGLYDSETCQWDSDDSNSTTGSSNQFGPNRRGPESDESGDSVGRFVHVSVPYHFESWWTGGMPRTALSFALEGCRVSHTEPIHLHV